MGDSRVVTLNQKDFTPSSESEWSRPGKPGKKDENQRALEELSKPFSGPRRPPPARFQRRKSRTYAIPTTNLFVRPKRQREIIEDQDRAYGYGNLDDWNALPPKDQARIRGHSLHLYQCFRPIQWFLLILGRFPFRTKQLQDGSFTFSQSPWSISYVYFVLTSIFIVSVFVLFSLGAFLTFIGINPKYTAQDRCGNSWGTNVISRNLPFVVFVWSQMMLAAAGSIYVLLNGRSFLHFYNMVNEAVMQLDIDATDHLRKANIRGSIVFGALFLIWVILFFASSFSSLEEVSFFVMHSITYFFMHNLYLIGTEFQSKGSPTSDPNPFSAYDYETIRPMCMDTCKSCFTDENPNQQLCEDSKCFNVMSVRTDSYILMKTLGFIIICFSMLSARALIQQLEFFCQVLVNLASTWNKRFLNYASKDNSVNMSDPYRRRITDRLVLKDHYEIVRIYNEVEANFSFILFVYYASVFFNFICQFYYMALLSTQVTCGTAVDRELEAALTNETSNDEKICVNSVEVKRFGLAKDLFKVAAFDDPCVEQKKFITDAHLTTAVLLVVTLTSFVITTLVADNVSRQGDIGFYRVRKRGYMACKTRNERNAMHSLVFSFTGPKHFCISAAGYFPIKKIVIVITVAVAFVYFLIIMGFKPGMVTSNMRCFNRFNRTVIRYPKVV